VKREKHPVCGSPVGENAGNPSFYSPLITRYLPGSIMVSHSWLLVITTGNKYVNTAKLQSNY
jgi:hypothetical protein